MTSGPATARGAATRRRIVDAAVSEFARYGIAGARIERIVNAARTNKAQLYAYFGSKERLFDTVFLESLEHITDAVRFDATDLADWAVRLYDEYLAHPELIRLATWVRLERSPSGRLAPEVEAFDDVKTAAIIDAQAAGTLRAGDPYDLMAMVIAMSMAWSPVSNVYAATADEPAECHDRRRALLRQAVQRVVAP
jgi:AcrR family transcriptional regulator